MMKRVTILKTEDFSEELCSTVESILTDLIDNRGAKMIEAGGDSKDMIYRLFKELSAKYPHIFFVINLSKDELAYENSDHIIFSLDCDTVYTDPKNAKKHRDDKLIKNTDIIICRKGSVYDNITAMRKKSGNPRIEIIAI